jgi:hypothetical protein
MIRRAAFADLRWAGSQWTCNRETVDLVPARDETNPLGRDTDYPASHVTVIPSNSVFYVQRMARLYFVA